MRNMDEVYAGEYDGLTEEDCGQPLTKHLGIAFRPSAGHQTEGAQCD